METLTFACNLVAMENWSVWAVGNYFRAKSTVQMQQYFLHVFHVPRRGRIPLHNSILKWDDDSNVHGGVLIRSAGPRHSIHTPEITIVQNAPQQSQSHLPRQSAHSLQALNTSFQRIFHEDLKFHPYMIQLKRSG